MAKESAAFITGRHTRSPGQLVLKKPELPDGFPGKVLKDRVRERVVGRDHLTDSLLTGWW